MGIPLFSFASPPREIPRELWNAFTLDNSISVEYMYRDEAQTTPTVFTPEMFDRYIEKAKKRETNYYGETDLFVYQALDEMADHIRGKEVCLIGSSLPWYEGILLSYEARPVVIEYNQIKASQKKISEIIPLSRMAALADPC